MRNYFKTQTFPTLQEIVKVFKESKYSKPYCEFFNMYYNSLLTISQIYGFSLIRLDFQELMCIVQRTEFTIIIELRIK